MSARLVSTEGFPREGCDLQIGFFDMVRDRSVSKETAKLDFGCPLWAATCRTQVQYAFEFVDLFSSDTD